MATLLPEATVLPGFIETGLYYATFALAVAIVVAITHHFRPWRVWTQDLAAIVATHTIAWVFAWHLGDATAAATLFALGLGLSIIGLYRLRRMTVAAQLYICATLMATVFGLAWALYFIDSLHISEATRSFLYFGFVIGLLGLPAFVGKVAVQAIHIGRRSWRRPRHSLSSDNQLPQPKVSIHVPCYAEPPEVVMETLDALSRLDYDDYEVLVIDNNTKDPALWRPVEAYCRRLGERFRFFHIDPLAGAKAGALNFALTQTASDAAIISCVDSDYVAEPDFLMRLVGFFANPHIGFVQTSHDYRNFSHSRYQRACYWDYMSFFKQHLPALNEWTAGFTVGTMCLIRRQALEQAGGWAEWCLTEDSEIGMRIHALGYESIVLPDTFGRGLIPDSFRDFQKQRFRWTAGPVQQLKRHVKLLLPKPLGGAGKMAPLQKYFEWLHCAEGLGTVARLLTTLLVPLFVYTAVNNNDSMPVPPVIWTLLGIGAPVSLAITWLLYQKLSANTSDMLLGSIATLSLTHTKDMATLVGLLARKPLAWTRTNKFMSLPNGLAALMSTKWELIRALVTISLGLVMLVFAGVSEPDFVLLGIIGILLAGLGQFAAPLMALLAERDLAHRPQTGAGCEQDAGILTGRYYQPVFADRPNGSPWRPVTVQAPDHSFPL